MTLANDLKPLITRIRAIPGQLGLRVHTVSILRRVWSGPHTGDGIKVDTETLLQEDNGQSPKVEWLNAQQRAVRGIESSNVMIGPITPSFSGGGTSLATIKAWQNAGDEVYVKLVGPRHPDGALYRITDVMADKALRYMIEAEPVAPA